MDRGQRRANERTSRQDFGVLKARKQSKVVKKLFYPSRLVLLAIDGELFDVHENGYRLPIAPTISKATTQPDEALIGEPVGPSTQGRESF